MATDRNETKRPYGERCNNPSAEVPMREVDMLDVAEKDGAHVLTSMGMGRKK